MVCFVLTFWSQRCDGEDIFYFALSARSAVLLHLPGSDLLFLVLSWKRTMVLPDPQPVSTNGKSCFP